MRYGIAGLALLALIATASESHAYIRRALLTATPGPAPAWVQANLGVSGAVPPDLSLEFDTGRGYAKNVPNIASAASLLSVTRASVGYEDDLAGNWWPFAAGQARITSKGLLVEEARTNSITNDSMQGAAIGTPGTLPTNWTSSNTTGLTQQITAIGTENGIDYIEVRLFGTAAAGAWNIFWDGTQTVAAVNGQAWSQSAFVRAVAGAWPAGSSVTLTVGQFNSSGVTLGAPLVTTFSPPPSGALASQRLVSNVTTNNASTAFVRAQFALNTAGAGTVDITLRIGWPQLEQGTFATSPIRTTGAAVARAADVVTALKPPAFATSHTLFVSAVPEAPSSYATAQVLLSADDAATGGSRTHIARAASTGTINGFINPANASIVTTPLVTAGVLTKGAYGVAPLSQAAVHDGGSVVTNATGTPASAALVAIHLGSQFNGGASANAYIVRVAIWPATALTGGQLATLTTPPAVLQSPATGAVAALDYDFQNGNYWQPGIGALPSLSVTRASVAYEDDTFGNWWPFAANVARITNKGLLVEGQETNGIRNNSMQGAVVGTPGTLPTNWATNSSDGLTQQIVGVGTENGIDYIEIRLSGTAVAGFHNYQFEVANQIPATNGQAWAISVFVKQTGGSWTNGTNLTVFVAQLDAGLVNLGNLIIVSPLSSIGSGALGTQRFGGSVTTTQATIAYVKPQIQLNFSAGPVDVTFRIGWPQLEQNPFATSPIRTTGAAATRNTDVVTAGALPTLGSSYTVFSAGSSYSNSLTVLGGLFGASNNDRIQLDRVSSPGFYPDVTMSAGGTNFWVLGGTGVAWPANVTQKLAAAYASGDHAFAAQGGAPLVDASAGVPALTQLRFGTEASAAAAFTWDGYITRLALWPSTRVPNSDLSFLTR